MCLKQLATAPFFHLKLTPCKVAETPQVLSWGPEPQPSPGASCGVPRGGMGLSFLCPPPAGHCPAPRGSPECPHPTSSSASFPTFPSAKAPPSLEARPCSEGRRVEPAASGARTLGSGCDVTLRGEPQGPLCLGGPRPGPQKTTGLWGGKDGAGSFRVGTHVLAAEAGPTTRAAALTLP